MLVGYDVILLRYHSMRRITVPLDQIRSLYDDICWKIVLLHDHVTLLLCEYYTTLLCYNVAMLQCDTFTVLLYSGVAV